MKYTSVISTSYKNILKPIFFQFDPENVHDLMTDSGEFLGKYKITKDLTKFVFSYQNKMLEQNIKGIKFSNPVGLSAGFDKDGRLIDILSDVGFGFHQVGTVTYNSYDGNPKPRLYRLKKSKAISVYYGLKNVGAKKIAKKLENHKSEIPMSISIGKTNRPYTSDKKAGIEDYFNCLKYFVDSKVGDFYTINISCPNTFGGEPFTNKKDLLQLLDRLSSIKISKPIFIKMPINLPWKEFKKLLDVCIKYKIDGVIIGNLNKDKSDKSIKDVIPNHIKGGISGRPTQELSNKLIEETYKYAGDKLIIVGVGGIFSAEDAYIKIKKGASLVQLITGMIYEGPQLVGQINSGLVKLLKKDGFKNISEAVGADFANN